MLAGRSRGRRLASYVLVADIEGAEAAILEQDAEALAGCQQIVIELHRVERGGRVHTVDDLAAALTGPHGFVLRARHLPVIEVIRSAMIHAAKVVDMEGEAGIVAPGAYADLIVVDGDPLSDITLLTGQGRHMPAIMKDGVFVKNKLHVD